MNLHEPTWLELRELHTRSSELWVSGTLSYRYNKRDGSLDQGLWSFQHGPNDRWRIERSGAVHYIRRGGTAYARFDDGMRATHADKTRFVSLLPINPMQFLGGPASILSALNTESQTPNVIGVATIAERAAWHVQVPGPSTDTTAEIDIDQETGMVLGLRGLGGMLAASIIEMRVHESIPDDRFAWNGPTARSRVVERSSVVDVSSLRDIPVAVPRYWPTGVGYTPHAGDADTGELIMILDVEDAPILARWPIGSPLTLLDRLLVVGHAYTVDWTDKTWNWRLYTRVPLAPAEFDRIRDSMRER
ncbi:hypothetical protein [Rhodococcus sp. 2G]|uniref:hypothetical protein n=1 Tax=Rhodococcus sp. 2G TaxID=1570939 RepID=UPI000AB7D0C0|nr:hypothetical protein [Rhodococcus sp. 2G]